MTEPLLPPNSRDAAAEAESWGSRLWLALGVVVVAAFLIQSHGISTWPMADDEVLSLVQMDRHHANPGFFSFPPDHLEKLPRAVPVWQAFQRTALAMLPDSLVGYRLPSVICGVLTAAVAFLLAARWRGLWFAVALSIAINGSQLFVHVAQINRFYSLPLLLLTLALSAMWLPFGRIGMVVATAGLGFLTVLSHNVTVAAFGLAFAASCATWLVGRTPVRVVARSGAAFVASALVYVLYLLPLIRGWHTTGNATQVLVSFTANAGVPLVALGILGGWLSLSRRDGEGQALWCGLMFAGSLCLFQVSTFSWNPRYFVFFLPALWVLAADAMDFVARKVNRGVTGAVWYGCVVLLLLPNLLSHYADGSRHDYRRAAAVVTDEARSDELILSDDAETISYYLPDDLLERLRVRTKVSAPPSTAFLLVARSNAWVPFPQFPGRRVQVLAEIHARRYDQFSHIVRVYRVHAGAASQLP